MKTLKNSKLIDFDIFDAHIHFGEYYDRFLSPEEINSILEGCGVKRYLAMLFPNKLLCNIEKDTWLNEKLLKQNLGIDLGLVISPTMLKKDPELTILNTLPYNIIKLHGLIHNWHPNGKNIQWVFNVARKRNMPIMLHTGGHIKSNAGTYKNICSNNKDVKVVLAHSRPLNETIDIMMDCPNVWADTSFLPNDGIIDFFNKGLSERVLFGTDFPMPIFFSVTENFQEWYIQNVYEIISAIGLDSFKIIANTNYINFFSQNENDK